METKAKNSKARINANNRYAQKTYTQLNFRVKKEDAEDIKQYIESTGKSFASFCLEAIYEKIARENQ